MPGPVPRGLSTKNWSHRQLPTAHAAAGILSAGHTNSPKDASMIEKDVSYESGAIMGGVSGLKTMGVHWPLPSVAGPMSRSCLLGKGFLQTLSLLVP